MEIQITRPGPADIDDIRSLFAETIRNTFEYEGIAHSCADDLTAEIENQNRLLDRDISSHGRDEYFLIAKSDHRIIGTIACGPANQLIRTYLQFDADITREIKSMYVLPQCQGRGVGSLLLEKILRYMRDNGHKRFCLDCGYKKAQKFWIRKLGKPTMVVRDHFGPGAHYMIWENSVPAAP
jgi:GNAT superfamily N-acetyltransferase